MNPSLQAQVLVAGIIGAVLVFASAQAPTRVRASGWYPVFLVAIVAENVALFDLILTRSVVAAVVLALGFACSYVAARQLKRRKEAPGPQPVPQRDETLNAIEDSTDENPGG